MLFALWPQSYLRVTELVIDVDEAFRGETGISKVLISAPERGGKLQSSERAIAIGDSGWLLGTVLDHATGGGKSMYIDSAGLTPSEPNEVKFAWFGTYDKATFRSQLGSLPADCARGAPRKN